MATFDGRSSNSYEHSTKSLPSPDMSNEYTCFLCNGFQTVIGSIIVDSVGVILLNALGMTLEMNTYDQLVSVNEPEPYSYHILILVFPQRYVVLSHLMRKSKLVELFKSVGLYKEEPKLPFEAIGFYNPEIINEGHHTTDASGSIRLLHKEEREGEMLHERVFIPINERGRHHDRLPTMRDQWSNKEEQERYVQREIQQQSLLNPIQILSSQDQARKNTVSGDWMQLERYPSYAASSQETENKKITNDQNDSSGRHPVITTITTSNSSYQQTESYATSSNIVKVHKQASQVRDSLLEQLKGVFPNHSDDTLQSALQRCHYQAEEAITLILNEDDID